MKLVFVALVFSFFALALSEEGRRNQYNDKSIKLHEHHEDHHEDERNEHRHNLDKKTENKHEIKDKKEQIVEKKHEIKDKKEEIVEKKHEIKDKKEEIVEKKHEIKDKKEEIKEKKEAKDHKEEIKEKKTEAKDHKEEIKEKKNEAKDHKEEIKEKKHEARDHKEEIKEKKNEAKDHKEEIKENKNEQVQRHHGRISSRSTHEEEEKYTDKYDMLDIDEIIKNKRMMNAYVKCVLEKGKCTAEGRELKSHIKDALQNGCKKCTSNQRQGMKKVISHLIHHDNESWKQLVKKYDPKEVYTHKYEQHLNSL